MQAQFLQSSENQTNLIPQFLYGILRLWQSRFKDPSKIEDDKPKRSAYVKKY